MSDVAKCRELLRRYSIARIPFITIDSIERSRALDILKSVSEELSLTFYVHTLSKGIYDLNTDKNISDDKSVYSAIEYMAEQMKRRQYMTIILTEVPDISTDNSDARQLFDLVTLANESGGVVIAMTNNPVWNLLQRQGMIVKLDMPDEDEMYSIIKEYIDDYRSEIPIEWDSKDIREAAATLAGVTKIEAENVMAALIANRRITKADMDEVRQAKDRLFADISGLEKIDVDEIVILCQHNKAFSFLANAAFSDAIYEPVEYSYEPYDANNNVTFNGQYLSGYWSDTQKRVSTCYAYPFILDTPLKKCRGFTVDFEVEVISGKMKSDSKFAVYIYNGSSWEKVGTFTLDDYEATAKIKMNKAKTVYEVVAVCMNSGTFSYNNYLGIRDVVY